MCYICIIYIINMSEAIYLKLPEKIKEEADLYVMSGYFDNRSEFIREAVREFLEKLEENRMNIAIELYRKEKISLGKAAEISVVGYEKMKEILIEREIPVRRGPQTSDELRSEYETTKEIP